MQTTVFLADKADAGLITGDKRRIGSSIVMLLVALVFIVGAVSSGYFLYTRFTQHQALITEGKQTRGTITDGFEETTRNYAIIETKRYHVEYRYTVNGVRYDGAQDIDGALFDQLLINSPVTIVFLPANPGIAELTGEFRDDTDFRNSMLILGGLTAVAVLAATYFLFVDMRNRRLSNQGQILDGQLLSAVGQYYRRTLNVTFTYTFRSPLGVEIRGKRRVKRNDMKKKTPVPPAGTPIKVLYVSDKLHRLL